MISIVSTYKNRRHHIEQTLPTWINQDTSGDYEIVIVDYESDDDISDFLISQNSKIPIKHVKCEDLPVFKLSHARNIGSHYASGKHLFFVDIDTLLPSTSIEFVMNRIIKGGVYLAAVDSQTRKEIVNGGLIAVSKGCHMSICGFNESLTGWGFEDIDYKRRLERIGLSFLEIPFEMYSCIDHPDEERTQCYDEEKEMSWNKNRQIALKNWEDKDFGKWDKVNIYTHER